MKAVLVHADPFLFVSSALTSPLLFLASNSVRHKGTLVSCMPCVQEVYMSNLAFASYENVLLWNWNSWHAEAVGREHFVYGRSTVRIPRGTPNIPTEDSWFYSVSSDICALLRLHYKRHIPRPCTFITHKLHISTWAVCVHSLMQTASEKNCSASKQADGGPYGNLNSFVV